MNEQERNRQGTDVPMWDPAPAVFGGAAQGMAVDDDPVDTDVIGEDAADGARNAAGADPAFEGRFDTAASNPNVISPPD